ncbi:MAG TPA: sulfotransferase [Allosphingosinicella sp.]|nr:sulfotransferase [Allosphingosinicella sp.]
MTLDLHLRAGLAAAQAGDPAAAIPHFRRVLEASPDDVPTRCNLALALLSVGALDEAGAVAAAGGADPRLRRLAAYAWQQQGRLAEAAAAYEAVLAAWPGDWESVNNLGNVRRAAGDLDGAIRAFREAARLKPDLIRIAINLSNALGAAERHEERLAVMRAAALRCPDDALAQTEYGVAAAEARDFAAAEGAYRAAIAAEPGFTPAHVELGLLLETQNRLDDLARLIEGAPAGPEIGFLKAWLLRRQGRFEEALPLAQGAPASIEPSRRAQLLGEIYDRLGDAPRAFAAFTEMNRAAEAAAPPADRTSYRREVADAAMNGGRPAEVEGARPSPAFILGFPRSGTTLLDTLLLNLPQLHVLEELPVLDAVERTPADSNGLRARYFEVLDELAPPGPGQLVIDKFPLHMARAPLIHRLFPDAKIVFVERHPCDAVLSCFMANFQLNHAMRAFTDIEEAARLYDAAMAAWTRARERLPLEVHAIRYERMVENLEAEMRPLLAFLGLDWDPKVLDNRAAAGARDYISTASYAQVAEPIYRRAAGRWQRYRDQLAPVLPILAPWAERLGYDL